MKNNDDAFKELAVNISTLYMKRSRNKYTYHADTDLINTIAFAMNLIPDKNKMKEGASGETVFFKNEDVEKINHILEAIKSIGGNKPGIIVYPTLLRTYSNEVIDSVAHLPVFCVKQSSSCKFVDVTGRVYTNHDDFVYNHPFPAGILAYPKRLHFSEDKNGNAIVETLLTETTGRAVLKVMDLGFTLTGLGAAALALTGVGLPLAIGLTIASTSYGLMRSTGTIIDRAGHYQSVNPFSDWEAFGAWTNLGVTALGVGCTLNALRLTEKISRLAVEGLRISTTTKIALRASIFVPYTINGAVMLTQFIRMARAWNNIPIEYKIITGLQLLFFIGAALRLRTLSVTGIQDHVAKMVYNDVRELLAQDPDGPFKVATLDRMIREVRGKYNPELINTLRKIANYDNGVLFATSRDLRFGGFGTFEPIVENGEVGFRFSDRIYIGPEAAIQFREDMKLAARENPGIYYSFRIPKSVTNRAAMPVQNPVDQIIVSRGLTDIKQVEESRHWLQNILHNMENMPVQSTFWNNMKYHDKMRLCVLPEMGKSLNNALTNLCLRYAAGDEIRTVGQYASRFEITFHIFHRRANDLNAKIKAYKEEKIKQNKNFTLAMAAKKFGIEIIIETKTRITYNSLPNVNNAFNENISESTLKSFEKKATDVLGPNIVQGWKSSITILAPKIVNSATRSLQTLANDIIALGDLSYGKSGQLLGNCSLLEQTKSFPIEIIKKSNFPKIVLENANKTIKSCRGHTNERVTDVSRQKENYRKIAFWDLDDGKTVKCTVVTIDKSNGQCRIQNFTTRNIEVITQTEKNLNKAILEHYSHTYTDEMLKFEIDSLMSRIKNECKDYVGAQLVRDWENHDNTVTDIQNLERVGFSSIEHALCHVVKHGEIRSEGEMVAAIRNYFQKAQEVIKYSKRHPEYVSSKWTQTGSARDFIFYRPPPANSKEGIEKVVVLVREGGEVIMKTYFVETSINKIPPQQKHVEISKLELRDANLQTFYFQIMFLTPRYGVLLPNDYEIIRCNVQNDDVARNIIIMAAHHFNEIGRIKEKELSEALTKTFPSNGNKWNVIAFPRYESRSLNLPHNTKWFIFARIGEMKILMYLCDKENADSKKSHRSY